MEYTVFEPATYLKQHLLNLERWHYAAVSVLENAGMCLQMVEKRSLDDLEEAIKQTKKLLTAHNAGAGQHPVPRVRRRTPA